MEAIKISTESSSDDLRETSAGTYPVRRKGSLLNRWKKSGLALRRYLYCLERKRSESSSNDEEKENDKECAPHAHRDHSDGSADVSNCAELSRVREIKNQAKCAKNSNCTFPNSHTHTNCFCLQFKNQQSKSLNYTDGLKNVNIPNDENGIGHNSSKKDNSRDILEDHSLEDKKGRTFHNADLLKHTTMELKDDDLSCHACQELNTGTCTSNAGQKLVVAHDRLSSKNFNLHHFPDLIPKKHNHNLESFHQQQNASGNNHGNNKRHFKIDCSNQGYNNNSSLYTHVCKNDVPFPENDVDISDYTKSNKISTLKQIAAEDGNVISGESQDISYGAHNFQKHSFPERTDFRENVSGHCNCSPDTLLKVKGQHSLVSKCLSCQEKKFNTDFSVNSQLKKTDTFSMFRDTVTNKYHDNVIDLETDPAYKYSKQKVDSHVAFDSHVASVSDNLSNDFVATTMTTSSPDEELLYKGDNYNHSGLLSIGNNHANIGIQSALEIKNSTSLSSDSVKTDSSSICDMADVSSEAILECRSSSVPSPKRQRKRLRTRTKSLTEDDNEEDFFKLDFGGDVDFGVLETALDYSPSGFLTSLSKIRLGSQLSDLEESTESETLSTGIPVFEDTDTTDSIPGLNYAMPYLSDRLKTRLAQRIGVGDLSNNGDVQNGETEKDQDKEKKCDDSQLTDNHKQDETSTQGQELLSSEAASGEYMTDERTLSDLLFNLDKIDMIDRVFLREDHSQDLGRLTNIQVSNHQLNNAQTMETDTASNGGDADDEFECDCQFCIGSRLNQDHNGSYRDEEFNDENTGHETVNHADDDESRNMSDDDRINLWMADEENMFTINIEELSPLDIMMNDRRSELELMFENVILQMLAVHPDLLNDQAPPPASRSVIQSLTSSPVTSQITGQSLSCPICLCIYEETDSMSTLPCQHQFHPLCIQAWLRQSGTCPVCRFVLK